VNVFVFVVKEAFDSPCFPQDYKDEIEVSELVQFFGKNKFACDWLQLTFQTYFRCSR